MADLEEETSNPLVKHAQRELQLVGMYDTNEYDSMMADAVVELISVFSKQGHSGMSADITLAMFDKVARFKPLSPITSNPDEWMDIGRDRGGNGLWMNTRRSSSFSRDGGTTWYDIEDASLNNGDVCMTTKTKKSVFDIFRRNR